MAIRVASIWDRKASEWISGRKDLFKRLEDDLKNNPKKRYWFHSSSLGEYELSKPLISGIKTKDPDALVVVTFFSPSAFEGKDSRDQGDLFYYLPLDSPSNAQKFIDLLQPEIAFFARYDLWYFFLLELEKRRIQSVLFSADFRKDQFYFKGLGKFMRNRLARISRIFVVSRKAKDLLAEYGIESKISGDARFDRVAEIVSLDRKFPEIEGFLENNTAFVVGSPWPSDMIHLKDVISTDGKKRVILAPHDISSSSIAYFRSLFPEESILFSELIKDAGSEKRILIIDNIGMLSSIYRYADIAYIGGGFKEGLHNIFEPAGWGKPVLFGPELHKFPEAVQLSQMKGGFVVENSEQIKKTIEYLSDPEVLKNASLMARKFIESGRGSVDLILGSIDPS